MYAATTGHTRYLSSKDRKTKTPPLPFRVKSLVLRGEFINVIRHAEGVEAGGSDEWALRFMQNEKYGEWIGLIKK